MGSAEIILPTDLVELELPVMVSKMLEPLLTIGKRYKVTYHLERAAYSEKQGRHTVTGELIKFSKPRRFYDYYDSWLEIKTRNNGNCTVRVGDILRIQGVH